MVCQAWSDGILANHTFLTQGLHHNSSLVPCAGTSLGDSVDHLCSVVVSMSDYQARGSGFDSRLPPSAAALQSRVGLCFFNNFPPCASVLCFPSPMPDTYSILVKPSVTPSSHLNFGSSRSSMIPCFAKQKPLRDVHLAQGRIYRGDERDWNTK